MHDIRALLADPGRNATCWPVVPTSGPRAGPAQMAAEGLRQEVGSHPVIDDVARGQYRRRLTELEQGNRRGRGARRPDGGSRCP
jgi:hypothetical protein